MRISKLLLYLTILSIPLGQFGRLPIGGGTVNLYLTDLLVAATVLIWLIETTAIEKDLKLPRLSAPIALFSSIALITLLNGARYIEQMQFLSSAMYWLRWLMYAGIYFSVSDLLRKEVVEFTTLKNLLVISGVVLATAGFIQLAILPDFASMTSEGWDPHQGRLLSTFFDPNFTGAYLVLTLCLLIPDIFSKKIKPLSIAFSAILTIALLLTFSRSAWLMFAAVIGTVSLFKSRKLLILATIIAFSAYFFVPRVQTRIAGGVDPDDSAQARIVNWKQSVTILKNDYNWLTGVGFNTYRYAQARYGFFTWDEPYGGKAGAGADSSLLFVFATTGIFGLAAYMWIYIKLLQNPLSQSFTSLLNKTKEIETSNLILMSATAGLLIESNFINSLFYTPIMLYIWILASQRHKQSEALLESRG